MIMFFKHFFVDKALKSVVTFCRHIQCGPVSKEQLDSVKRVARQLTADVVTSMVPELNVAKLRPSNCKHTVTLLRVVHELSSKHEIVFESIARKLQLQVNGHRDAEVCRRTFVGVVDELFSDGRYNWGRVVTVFAYAGWLARGCKSNSEINVNSWSDIVTEVAGDCIGNKLSLWVCQQGGWVSACVLIADRYRNTKYLDPKPTNIAAKLNFCSSSHKTAPQKFSSSQKLTEKRLSHLNFRMIALFL